MGTPLYFLLPTSIPTAPLPSQAGHILRGQEVLSSWAEKLFIFRENCFHKEEGFSQLVSSALSLLQGPDLALGFLGSLRGPTLHVVSLAGLWDPHCVSVSIPAPSTYS